MSNRVAVHFYPRKSALIRVQDFSMKVVS